MLQSLVAPSDVSERFDGDLPILLLTSEMIAVDKPSGLRSTPAFKGEDDALSGGTKRKRQQRFSDVIESMGAHEVTPPDAESAFLAKLARESKTVPRNRGKFGTYCKRSLRCDDESVVERLWLRILHSVGAEEKRDGMTSTDSALTRVQAAYGSDSSPTATSAAAAAASGESNTVETTAAAAQPAVAVETVRAVHRLDMETSGVLLLARTRLASAALGKQFEERHVRKTYVAIVLGTVEGERGTIDKPLRPHPDPAKRPRQQVMVTMPQDDDDDDGTTGGTRGSGGVGGGKPASTDWVVRERMEVATSKGCEFRTRLELRPLTGRTHQLRVHLASIGHPIIGDSLYFFDPQAKTTSDEGKATSGERGASAESKDSTKGASVDSGVPSLPTFGGPDRLLLHAESLEFSDPASQERVRLFARCPF
jgi:23S rRNA-/tRNA-specific pseudouridylate synthase